jgi:hypothetical protein
MVLYPQQQIITQRPGLLSLIPLGIRTTDVNKSKLFLHARGSTRQTGDSFERVINIIQRYFPYLLFGYALKLGGGHPDKPAENRVSRISKH